jgi:hypothetical protein
MIPMSIYSMSITKNKNKNYGNFTRSRSIRKTKMSNNSDRVTASREAKRLISNQQNLYEYKRSNNGFNEAVNH